MTRLLPILVFVASIFLSACSGTSPMRDAVPFIDVSRKAETGIASGEQVVVILAGYKHEGNEVKDMRSAEGRFEDCTGTGMRGVRSDLALLPAAEFRKRASTAAMNANLTDPPESLLRAFSEPAAAARIAEANVRYVVLLKATYSTSKGMPLGPEVIGKRWLKRSYIEAKILDLKHARVAGSASSALMGDEEVGVTMQVIPLPIPLHTSSGDTQGRNCHEFGEALVRFILGK